MIAFGRGHRFSSWFCGWPRPSFLVQSFGELSGEGRGLRHAQLPEELCEEFQPLLHRQVVGQRLVSPYGVGILGTEVRFIQRIGVRPLGTKDGIELVARPARANLRVHSVASLSTTGSRVRRAPRT